MKSRKALYESLKTIEGAMLPKTYKDFSNETYGKQSMIYPSFDTVENRFKGERILIDLGYKVNTGYYLGSATTSVQVSYFKGDRWWE